MKRLILIVLLIAAGNGWGAWTNVNENEESTFYLDFETARPSGNLVKIWALLDNKKIKTLDKGKDLFSVAIQFQFNCSEEESKTLAYTSYSDHMGKGEVVFSSSSAGKWEPVVPNSVGAHMFKIVCAKQREGLEERSRVETPAAVAVRSRASQQKTVVDFLAQIQASIRSKIVIPASMSGNPEVIYDVVLFANGTLISTRLAKSSGVPAYDEAVLRAIRAAEPLPLPTDPELFQQAFRELRLAFRPIE